MWAHRPPNRPHDPTQPGAPAPKLLPSPPKVPPPPATPKASKYSSVRQNELEELRQRGLAKLFNKHFTTVTQQIAVERAAADKALKDLEARRLNEFKETNYGATISNYDQMVLELQRKRDECKRKERETLLLYQRYVHKFGNKAGAMAVPSITDAAAIPEDKELLHLPPLVVKRQQDPTSGLHVSDRTDEIESDLQQFMEKGAQRHPSIRDLGVSETYKTLQDAVEQQERDFIKHNTSTVHADVKSSPLPTSKSKSKKLPGSLGQRGSQFENDTTILHEPGEMPPQQQQQQQQETPQTPVPHKQAVDSATDTASSTATTTTTITASSSDNNTGAGGDRTPPPSKSTITTTEAKEAVHKTATTTTTSTTTSSSLLPPPLVASTPGSSSSTLAPTPAKATTTAVAEQSSSTTTTADVASATAAMEQRQISPEKPTTTSSSSNGVTFEEKQQAEVSSSSATSYNENDDDFLVRDDHALHNVSMSTTDDDIMSAHSAVSGLTSVEIISDAELKLLDFLRTETEAIRQMLDEQEDAASVKSSNSSPTQNNSVSVSALALQYGASSSSSITGSVTDNMLVTDDMSETQRATLQAEEMVREMQRVLEEAQAEQQHHHHHHQQGSTTDNPNTTSDTFSTWTPPNTKKSSSSSLYSAGGTSTTTPVSIQKEPYRLETTNPHEEWMVYYDDQHQRKYYHEVNSNVVQWEKPSTATPVQPSSLLTSAVEGGDGSTNEGGRVSSPTLSRASPVTVRSMTTTVSADDHDYVPMKDYSKKKNKSRASSDAGSVTSYRSGGAASYSSGPLLEDDSTSNNNVPGSTTSSARGGAATAPTIMSGVSTESHLLSYEDVMPETGGGHRPGLLRSPSGGGIAGGAGVSRRVLYRRQQRRKRNRQRVALLAGAVVAVTASVYCKKEIATVVDVLVPDSVEYQLHHVMTNHVNPHVPTFLQWTSSKVQTKELEEKARIEKQLKQQQEALELKKRQELEHQAQLEKERQAKAEAARQAKLQAQLEAERKAKEEAALKRKLESEIRAKLEAEQKAKEEALAAQRKAKEAAEAAAAQQKAAEADAESQRIKEETARQAAEAAEIAQQTMEVERKSREDSEAALAVLEASADEEEDYEIALQYKERPMVCNVPLSYVIPGKCRRMAKAKPIYDVTSLVGSMMQ